MREALESLSVWSGGAVVSVVSAAMVWLLCSLGPAALRKLWIVIAPIAVSFCLYWSPVWLGADSAEYSAWAFAFMLPWFVAGAIPSAVIVRLFEKRGDR
jgi:hypothetical protein